MNEFVEGMHKIGEALSAAVSAQVTKEAQERHEEKVRLLEKPG